jgi:hypothetical protein
MPVIIILPFTSALIVFVHIIEKVVKKIIEDGMNSLDVRIPVMTNTPFTIVICELNFFIEGLG